MRKLIVSLLAAAALMALAAPSFAAGRSVKIGDDYFVRDDATPTVRVDKGTRVTWRWSGNGLHNVAVTSGPVKFRSSLKTSGTYRRTMRKAGLYKIHCTVHSGMKMTLRVRR